MCEDSAQGHIYSSLLHFDGGNDSTIFTDDTGKTWSAFGNAKISTAQSVFGGASALFDGAGDYLSLATSADLNFGTGDFTIAGWLYWASATNAYQAILATGHTSYVTGVRFLILYGADRKLGFGGFTSDLGANVLVVTPGTIPLTTWTHFAVTRNGTTLRLFVDGELVATATTAAAFDFSANGTSVARNGWDGTNGYFNGRIDDFLIIKGSALYTAAFDVPETPYSMLTSYGKNALIFESVMPV